MTICDYDGRTALHLAAAEGQEQAVKFLLETCGVPPNPKDRYIVHHSNKIQSFYYTESPRKYETDQFICFMLSYSQLGLD